MASRGHFRSNLLDDSIRKGHVHCFTSATRGKQFMLNLPTKFTESTQVKV